MPPGTVLHVDWLPATPWLPVTAPLTAGTASPRSPELLERILDQFDVEHQPRYLNLDRDGDGQPDGTRCSRYTQDVTLALGAPIPQLWFAPGKGWLELSANRMQWWLMAVGVVSHGWEPLSGPDADAVAQSFADQGFVAVATWAHPRGDRGITVSETSPSRGSGHIAPLRPSRGEPGVWISQAGRQNFARGRLEEGFGIVQPILFFVHR